MPINYGPIVQGGAVLGSTLLAGRQRPEERQAVQAGTDVLNLGLGTARNLLPSGQGYIRQGIGTMQPSLDYWRGLLSGGQATTAAAAPDIQRIGEQYDAVRRGQAELTPRGGGRASLLNELPYQRMRDISNVITQQRAAAAPALSQAGGAIASTGSATINNAINSLYTTSRAGQDLLNYARQRQATDIEQGRGIGAGIVDIAKGVVPKWFNPTSSGGGGGPRDLTSEEQAWLGGGGGSSSLIGGPGIPGGESLGIPQSAANTAKALLPAAIPAATSAAGGTAAIGALAGIPGAGGALAAPSIAAPALAPGVAGGGVSGALGLGGGSGLLGLGAATIPVIGAAVGGALLLNHYIGQGRKAANVLTGDGGMQRGFEQTLKVIDQMNLPPDQAQQKKVEAYNQLVQLGMEHAQKGQNERKVVTQMFDTISPLFGQQNPLTQQNQTARGLVQPVAGKVF